jgi:PAS domain S-box-containing protein
MKLGLDLNRLPVQLVLNFLVVVLLTATLVGLPASWLLQDQLDQQSWTLVDQAKKAVLSLYDRSQVELQNTAILTAQRPTLISLLRSGDYLTLAEYLSTLQSGAGVDLIQICRSGSMIAGTTSQTRLCGDPQLSGYILRGQAAWLVASTSLDSGDGGQVVVGYQLDRVFSEGIRDQIALEQGLYWDQHLQVSSFSDSVTAAAVEDCIDRSLSGKMQTGCTLDGVEYNLALFPLDEEGLFSLVALDISDIHHTQQRLVWWMAAAILGISGVGTLLGVLSSQRISRPLVRLSRAAEAFSRGDLENPVLTASRLREIKGVAMALEDARVDLRESLRSLQNERDWSENLLASIVEGIITLDSEKRITFFSHGAERATGWKSDQVDGRSIDEVFQLADTDQPFSSILPSIFSGRQKADVILPDNRVASIAITSASLPQTGPSETEIALVFRDISEEEAVHRLLGRFIADVAHELRTPLSALEASIELLLDQAPTLEVEELNELYNSLHLGILGLHNLVDNLLESASIEARRFRISPRKAELGMIIAEAVQTMRPLLSKYHQTISVELPVDLPVVRADPRRTVQVLVNLISNASRYGPPGEQINIRVVNVEHFTRLEVIDRGPGIAPEHRLNLFRRFEFPHDDRAGSQAGAGLGLSVVKAIVNAHGGEVGVDDRPGGGSIFWFTLPVYKEAE